MQHNCQDSPPLNIPAATWTTIIVALEMVSYRCQVSLYNPLLIYLRILSRGEVPLILEVGKEFLRIPCRHPLYFTVFITLIYIFKLLSYQEPFANEKNTESIADDKATALSCIEQCLTVLRDERLGPFDFVLKILDNSNPDYLLHRRHLYKESSTKLFEILDAIAANDNGKRKLRSWLQQPQPFALVASIINDEMDTVQKAEKLPGIASITPSFIEDWTICEERQRAPCLTQLLGVAAQTVLAKGKNKKKTPETVRSLIFLWREIDKIT